MSVIRPDKLSEKEVALSMTLENVVAKTRVEAYSGGGLRIKKGQVLRVTNLEGEQIGDLFAVNANDSGEFLSASETRNFTFRSFPEVGEFFFSNKRRPMLSLIESPTHCTHDMLFAPCSTEMYELLANEKNHPNCRDNYLKSIRDLLGTETLVPDPINIFQNSPLESDGVFGVYVSKARAGDYVKFRAEMDLVIVLTSCSWDVTHVAKPNGDTCSPMLLEVLN